jgi:hypothetical protein
MSRRCRCRNSSTALRSARESSRRTQPIPNWTKRTRFLTNAPAYGHDLAVVTAVPGLIHEGHRGCPLAPGGAGLAPVNDPSQVSLPGHDQRPENPACDVVTAAPVVDSAIEDRFEVSKKPKGQSLGIAANQRNADVLLLCPRRMQQAEGLVEHSGDRPILEQGFRLAEDLPDGGGLESKELRRAPGVSVLVRLDGRVRPRGQAPVHRRTESGSPHASPCSTRLALLADLTHSQLTIPSTSVSIMRTSSCLVIRVASTSANPIPAIAHSPPAGS